MAKYCIPVKSAMRLKEAFQNGEIKIDELYKNSSKENRELFKGLTGDEALAKEINADFEKAKVSKQKDALAKWINKNTSIKDRKIRDPLLKDLDILDKMGALDPENADEFLGDLVSKQMGITVTLEETREIVEKSKKLSEAFEKFQTSQDKGFDSSLGGLHDYLMVRKDMDAYIQSLNPSSALKVTTGTIFRGNLIANLFSPVVNITGNVTEGINRAILRRIENRLPTIANKEVSKQYANWARKTYSETGYDITRMYDLSGGRNIRGEEVVHSEGKGTIRAIGRLYQDIVFKKLQGLPDVISSSIARTDSADLLSMRWVLDNTKLTGEAARKEAAEIMKDSLSMSPRTDAGRFVQEASISDALGSTFQANTKYGEVSKKLKESLNTATGDLRAGDIAIPFVKTVANYLGTGLDRAGVGAIKAVYLVAKGIAKGTINEDQMKTAILKNIVSTGYGLTGAMFISMMFDPKDYIGAYPTTESEQKLLEEKNALPNSVKIGSKWVSLDYFGTFGIALSGMMAVKKYGKDRNTAEKAVLYGGGTLMGVVQMPGLEVIAEGYDYLNKVYNKQKKIEAKDVSESVGKFLAARAIPSFMMSISDATDTAKRETKGGGFWGPIKAKVPGFRQQLPEKKTVTGETVETEGIISTILLGSRVKTARNNATVNELSRLQENGYLPSLTDITKRGRGKDLKEQISEEEYVKFQTEFANEYKSKITAKIASPLGYKNKTDEKKKEILDKIKGDVLDKYLRKYKYKKPKTPTPE